MKPLRLTMQAFGPFPGVVEVDFAHLQAGGLFLIHGPTGAGKTSILDALCFSLFGTSSGDRKGENLRSDLADPDLPTSVVLEFSLGLKRYRVRRTPKQRVRKKRSSESMIQKPQAELECLDQSLIGGLQVISGTDRTDAAINEILGMDENQFRQVVVLPQGQFRRFLAAGSEERESLLEVLFRSDRFRLLTENLQSRSEETKTAWQAENALRQAQMTALEISDVAELETQSGSVEQEVAGLALRQSELHGLHKQNLDSLQSAKKFAQTKHELFVSETQLQELEAERPRFEDEQRKLIRAEAAQPALIKDRECLRRETELLESRARLSETTQQITENTRHAEEHRVQLANLRQQIEDPESGLDALKLARERLGEKWRDASRLQREQASRTRLLSEFERIRSEHAAAIATFTETENQLLQNQARVEALQEKISAQPPVQEREAALDRELGRLQGDLVDAEKRLQLLRQQSTLAKKTQAQTSNLHGDLKKTQLAYHTSQAARIAQELHPGTPCPVCGSPEHPHPAQLHDDKQTATLEDVQSLQAKLEEAGTASSAALAAKQSQAEGLRLILKRLSTDETPTIASDSIDPEAQGLDLLGLGHARLLVLQQRRQDLLLTRKTGEALLVDFAKTKDLLKALQLDLKTCQEKCKGLQAKLSEKELELAATQAALSQLEERVPETDRDPESIGRRGQELRARLESLEKHWLEASGREEELKTRTATLNSQKSLLGKQEESQYRELEKSLAELAALLSKSEFVDRESARQARVNELEKSEITARVQRFQERQTQLRDRAQQAQAELDRLPVSAQNLPARQSEFDAIDQERSRVSSRLLHLQERVGSLAKAKDALLKLNESCRNLEEKYKIVGRLAGVASGHPQFNPSRIALQRYVLAHRLDEVLMSASLRLKQMSRGQFRLLRSQSQDDKRRIAGLELEVEDALTCTRRPTASLSGGEGFIASLCLALGLADVVQAQFGGIRLETVFVDEGFGTLDAEALELVMKTLASLQTGGRIVGVISHVPELQEQIANRLMVSKTLTGSHLRWAATVGRTQPEALQN